LSDFKDTSIFSKDIRKILKIPNFMKIRLEEADLLFHEAGHTDRHDEADSRFPKLCKKRLKIQAIFFSINYCTHLCKLIAF
jgi:hypothetical protein